MTFLKLEQFMKILYPKLVCFGYHFLENLPIVCPASIDRTDVQSGLTVNGVETPYQIVNPMQFNPIGLISFIFPINYKGIER